jgi:multidrug resistance efflux pump
MHQIKSSRPSGRVAEIYLGVSGEVRQGAPIFKLDSRKQEAALELARRNIAEIDAKMVSAQADIAAAEGQVQEAKAMHEQAVDELRTKEAMVHVVATTPLDVMLAAMEDALSRGDMPSAAASAKDTAPYMHLRLQDVIHAQEFSGRSELEQLVEEIDGTSRGIPHTEPQY